MPNKFSAEVQAAAVARYRAGEPVRAIAEALGCFPASVRQWAAKAGAPKQPTPPRGRKYAAQLPRILELRAAGRSAGEIAAEVGIDVRAVSYQALSAGVKLTPEQRGSLVRSLTPEQVLEVSSRRRAGEDRGAIATSLGVSLAVVKRELKVAGVRVSREVAQRNALAAHRVADPGWEKLKEVARARLGRREQEEFDRGGQTRSTYHVATLGFPSQGARYRAEAVVRDGRYTGSETATTDEKVGWECSKGHTWEATPKNVMSNDSWCPRCVHHISRPQLQVYEYVKSVLPAGTEVVLGDRTVLKPLELDVYVPSLQLGVEYHGLYWHSSAVPGFRPGRDAEKARRCAAAGVNLLLIYQDEWADPGKRQVLEGMLRWRLGAFAGARLGARELELVTYKDPGGPEVRDLLTRSHLNGWCRATGAYVLYRGTTPVQVATTRRNFRGELELARLASDPAYAVRGGAARLVAAVRRAHPGEPLVAFSDNRLSRGGVYAALGFREATETAQPSYYYTDGAARVWRWRCRRVNDPATLAAYPTEAAQAAGGVFSQALFGDRRPLYRVEDAGHRKWSLG